MANGGGNAFNVRTEGTHMIKDYLSNIFDTNDEQIKWLKKQQKEKFLQSNN